MTLMTVLYRLFGIPGQAVERLLMRPVDKLYVWDAAADQYVPDPPSRLGRKEDEAGLVGEVEEVGDIAPGAATRSMQGRGQRCRLLGSVAFGNIKETAHPKSSPSASTALA
jgi:hypothetical protein